MSNDFQHHSSVDSSSSSPENDSHERSRQPTPAPSADPPPQSVNHSVDSPRDGVAASRARTVHRKDKNRLHAIRHGALSRYPLEALTGLGENIRPLRDYERALRKELNPSGVLGAILFDRFWSSYLRCLLAARADAAGFNPSARQAEMPGHAAAIIDGNLPTLITIDRVPVHESISPDLLRQLALVEKYDRHFSREMYRALTMLLAAKNGGQEGIVKYMRQALPSSIDRSEGPADE